MSNKMLFFMMGQVKQKDKQVLLFVYTILTVIIVVATNSVTNMRYDSWLGWINLIFISMLVVQIFLSQRVFGKLFNLSVILLLFTYLFNFSYPFILQFGGDEFVEQVNYKIRHFSSSEFQMMVYYPVIYLSLLFWGMIFYEVVRKPKRSINKHASESSYKGLAIMMIVLSLPVDMAFMYIRIRAMMLGGYGEALATAVEGKYYASFFSYLLIVGVYLLTQSANQSKRNLYIVLYCIYEVFWMFSGQRATPLICIIVILWLNWGFGKQIRASQLLKAAVAGFFVVLILNVIREFRETGFHNLGIADVIGLNVFFDSMVEFGFTINIFGYVIQDSGHHVIGSSLMYDIIHILPKVSELNLDVSDVDIYEALDLHDKGASYLAEILYDFKQFSFLVMVLYGIYVRWLDCTFAHLIQCKDYNKVLKYIPLAIVTIFCVRTGLINLFRTFVYTWILISIVQIFNSIGKTNNIKFENNKYIKLQ